MEKIMTNLQLVWTVVQESFTTEAFQGTLAVLFIFTCVFLIMWDNVN